MAQRPFKVVAVALANKIAQTIWALLVKGGIYQAPPAITKRSLNTGFPALRRRRGQQGAQ